MQEILLDLNVIRLQNQIYNNSSVKQKYQVNLKSGTEPIDVYLVNREVEQFEDSNAIDSSNNTLEELKKVEIEVKESGNKSSY